jgi:hypothetical protein
VNQLGDPTINLGVQSLQFAVAKPPFKVDQHREQTRRRWFVDTAARAQCRGNVPADETGMALAPQFESFAHGSRSSSESMPNMAAGSVAAGSQALAHPAAGAIAARHESVTNRTDTT